MKTKKQIFAIALTACIMFMLSAITTQSQILFEGLCSEGEGGASWNADGSGPEPYGNGHDNVYYYSATNDYVNNASTSGGHMLDNINGFPLFEQALMDNGFPAEEITIKVALCDMGDDVEGIDYFTIGNTHYANFYPVICTFELNGEPLVEAIGNYSIYISSPGFQGFESAYLKVINISGNSPDPVKNVANALLSDIGSDEIKFDMEAIYVTNFSGNGRSGSYFDINFSFEKGLPTMPFQGLAADHEGSVGWDADGTGPEPLRDGHAGYPYFGASRDYDDIDPDPNAAFGRLLNGSQGFLNFFLQLDYRGYAPEQVKIKAGLCDFDEDIEGEDWTLIGGIDRLNYYHSSCIIELDGEPLIGFVLDTLKYVSGTVWNVTSSFAIVYDASENSPADLQLVAQAFLKDIDSCQIRIEYETEFVGTFTGNGRDGVFWQNNSGNIIAKESKCTRVYEGTVSGTWNASCSPYIIEGEITVPVGETLTIEPGVWVKFMDRYPVKVEGSVEANGLSTNTGGIVFTAVNPEKGWGGFDLDGITATESVSFDNCIFEYGSAYGENALNSGGAIAVANFDNLTIDHCLFRHNWADKSGTYLPSGGAIALWESSPLISNSIFSNNNADLGGAIMCYSGSNPEISKCLFYNNEAGQDGGALEIYEYCYPIITNNTFSLNTAVQSGGAVDVYSNSELILSNNIFWGNDATAGKQIAVTSNNCNVSLTYCDIQNGEAGIGPFGIGSGTYENNLETDPVFAVPLAWNFYLADASPCINTGDPTLFDPDGTISDMGAFYYSIPFAPVALEGEEITSTSFYAKWEMNFAVTGYLLDVATDENFDNLVPGYEGLDVGYTYIYEVTVPSSNTPYYYRLSAYNAAGTSDYSNTILIFITEIEETLSESSSGLIVVPNPVNHQGNISLELKEASDVQIEIFNYTGQKVLSETSVKMQKGQVSIPIDLSLLPPGSYICRVTTDKSIHTTKFIKN